MPAKLVNRAQREVLRRVGPEDRLHAGHVASWMSIPEAEAVQVLLALHDRDLLDFEAVVECPRGHVRWNRFNAMPPPGMLMSLCPQCREPESGEFPTIFLIFELSDEYGFLEEKKTA